MKKIGGKNFWLILIISIISLIVLIVGIIFQTKTSAKEFYSEGYIISSNASKTDKYYFKENTVYKENVFEEYVFKDKDNKEVSTNKENFIHYKDESLSFMKNGVILDLDSLKSTIVPYYNITDKSIIKYNNGSYSIETSDKTLIFNNFLGKITDNKYIVAGKDIRIKLSGNEELIKGTYFEILFVEDGIVKIENEEHSYQTVSTGSTIYVGENIKIDLGEKTVLNNDETRLSLTEMTIDGNENIDIKPSDGKVDTGGKGEGSSTNEETDNDGNIGGNQNGTDSNSDNNTPNTDGDKNNEEITSVIKKELSVNLITAKVGLGSLKASLQVIDTDNFIKGDLKLSIINTLTGESIYDKDLSKVSDLQEVITGNILLPGNNYVLTVYENVNGTRNEYFKKYFKTEALDLKLIREVVTTSSLSYTLDFGSSIDVKSADITIKDETGKTLNTYTNVTKDDNYVVFDGLDKNTTYNIVVDSVVFNNTNYDSGYTINTSDTTLKEKPTLGTINVDTDSDGQKFILTAKDFADPDKSITKYTYEIYKAEDITLENASKATPVYSFSKDKLDKVTLNIGENNIVGKQNYFYKIVVEYFDNYKYNEISTPFSDSFVIVGRPSIEFTKESIDFNQITGKVKLKDDSCTVPLEGRECFNEDSTFTITYIASSDEGMTLPKTINNVKFSAETLEYDLSVSGLTENTWYNFEVYGPIDLHDGQGKKENQLIGTFRVRTDTIESLKMTNWQQEESTFNIPINVTTEMLSTGGANYGDKIQTITFNLYRGDVGKDLKEGLHIEPIATFIDNDNIKDKYYNHKFAITSSMLNIESLTALKELSGGKLNRYYTIEVTDAKDSSGTNTFKIENRTFRFEVPAILLVEDEVEKPQIIVEEITNEMLKSGEYEKQYSSQLSDTIVVGYNLKAVFDKSKIESYFQGEHPVKKINFYAYNTNGVEIKKQELDLTESDIYEVNFFLGEGTDYNTVDKDMRRGNTYTFATDITIDTDGAGKYISYPEEKPQSEAFTSVKQDPVFNMYIDNSTKDSITYKYKITDIDNAIYKDIEEESYQIYYNVGDSEEEYSSNIIIDKDLSDVTISNLESSSIYTLKYIRANTKKASSIYKVDIGKYLFDGEYSIGDYNLGYKLDYGNFDNRLKIIIAENDFLNRIAAYQVTLTSGKDKYEEVITNLSDCDGNKCIIIDYADIKSFKGKDIKVKVQAFYDTGLIGFSQKTKLAAYLKELNLVNDEDLSKVGYVYQNTSTTSPGQYVYIDGNAYLKSSTPKGILGFNLNTKNKTWYLTTTNLIDIKGKKFVPFGTILKENGIVRLTSNGIIEVSDGVDRSTFNPKVLDIGTIQTDNDNFKFTSITTKTTTTTKPLINGAVVDVELSADTDSGDFVKTEGKYKFYIDIYSSEDLSKESFVKTVEFDLDNLQGVTFTGLAPDTTYYYTVSADMNKNGENVKTPLFDYNRSGYVQYKTKFKTLGKDDIFNRIDFKYYSEIDGDIYSKRTMDTRATLRTSTNMNFEFILLDPDGKVEYTKIIQNDDIENIVKSGSNYVVKYLEDITGKDFVFGENYHTLVINAITTDLGLKLELYNAPLKNVMGVDIGELVEPTFTITSNATINDKGNGKYSYGIDYKIVVKDEDHVIEDGIYEIQLQDGSNKNVCPNNEESCPKIIDIKKDGVNITGSYDDLEADTNYVIHIVAKTYRNNLSLSNKEGKVEPIKVQFTKSHLNFSLGLVTPTAISKNELEITFIGAANLEASLKKLDYNINVINGPNIAQGSLKIGEDINFRLNSNGYPTLTIKIPEGNELGSTNYISITYWIEDENKNLVELELNGKTTFGYGIAEK